MSGRCQTNAALGTGGRRPGVRSPQPSRILQGLNPPLMRGSPMACLRVRGFLSGAPHGPQRFRSVVRPSARGMLLRPDCPAGSAGTGGSSGPGGQGSRPWPAGRLGSQARASGTRRPPLTLPGVSRQPRRRGGRPARRPGLYRPLRRGRRFLIYRGPTLHSPAGRVSRERLTEPGAPQMRARGGESAAVLRPLRASHQRRGATQNADRGTDAGGATVTASPQASPEEPPGEPNASIARWGNRTTPVLPVLSSRHARCTSLLTEHQAERGIVPGAETGAAVGSNSGGSVSWRNVSALPLLRSGRVAEGARRAGAARAGHRAGGAARAGPREAREGRGPGSEPRGCQVRSRGWGRERAVWCGRKGHPEGKTSRRPGGLRTPGPGL
nr:translation initiation factor IF-2-like [Manis javanica]